MTAGLRTFLHWAVFILLLYGTLELCSFAGLYLLKRYKNIEYSTADFRISESQKNSILRAVEGESIYIKHDPVTGWTIAKNGESGLYKSNSEGIRSDREYALPAPNGIVRIGTFGDSFTHGDDVHNNETWQSYMEEGNQDIEALNFGVGGYGTDQALLRFRTEGTKADLDYVLIGFFSDNINRNVNTFRPFLMSNTGLPLGKPRFALDADGNLAGIPNLFSKQDLYFGFVKNPKPLMRQMGKWDYFYNLKLRSGPWDFLPSVRIVKIAKTHLQHREGIFANRQYNTSSEAFLVTAAIMDAFTKETRDIGAKPMFVFFPSKDDLKTFGAHGIKVYQPLIDWMIQKRYDYVDVIDLFSRNDGLSNPEQFYNPNHFSPASNKMIAEYLLEHLDL